MKVDGKHYRTIWIKEGNTEVIQIIDQRSLPHRFVIEDLTNTDECANAIKEMHVRGAGLIGTVAGFGMYLGTLECRMESSLESFNRSLFAIGEKLKRTRPTAVNLQWAVDRVLNKVKRLKTSEERIQIAFEEAGQIADEDASFCQRIGEHGVEVIKKIANRKRDKPVNILTHCNAGWLAFVDYGSATAPIYEAHKQGVDVHVWVDETRPRNQGSKLTAWELGKEGVSHTIITDNAGGHLMQHGMVDMVIVGTDRTTVTGDVANKIGTYLKALSARDNNIPFYVALPSSTFDWGMKDGVKAISIEQRSEDEVKWIEGLDVDGNLTKVLLAPESSPAANYGFDVTPARLVTGLITERGICRAHEEAILDLYPEKRNVQSEP
jgi:methylthioribose-1-phosphate isomerase